MFPERLRELRKKSKLTLNDVGNKLGLSTSTIGMYERSGRVPDYQIVADLANLFGVSADYLLGKSDNPIISKAKFKKERLIELRGDLSLDEFSKLTNVSKVVLERYENGLDEPIPSILSYIAESQGVEPEYFYADDIKNIKHIPISSPAFLLYSKELRDWINSPDSQEYLEFAYKIYKNGITKEQLQNGKITITL
ncbi:MAG: helix-turn-helix transcriptional regulator [Bacillota bacterium]|nr:helix-turn-helix transcriptional regulator [Bacillota bacterium]